MKWNLEVQLPCGRCSSCMIEDWEECKDYRGIYYASYNTKKECQVKADMFAQPMKKVLIFKQSDYKAR